MTGQIDKFPNVLYKGQRFLLVQTSEFEKFFYLLNKGRVSVKFSHAYYHGGERKIDGFNIVIDD